MGNTAVTWAGQRFCPNASVFERTLPGHLCRGGATLSGPKVARMNVPAHQTGIET
jgi:hypothetical protein